MRITLISFGFKRAIMPVADMVFDVRFLKNPHYDPGLQPLSGLSTAVGAHIESDPDFQNFFALLTGLLALALPRSAEKGREEMTIAIGCTGGRHRSVYTVQKLGAFLRANDYNVTILHRDLEI